MKIKSSKKLEKPKAKLIFFLNYVGKYFCVYKALQNLRTCFVKPQCNGKFMFQLHQHTTTWEYPISGYFYLLLKKFYDLMYSIIYSHIYTDITKLK